ncbi:MAG: hypothetical protein IJX47_00090 [Clostridia bacterium]|nr:hypothetical protein [Clostridia bacterium]
MTEQKYLYVVLTATESLVARAVHRLTHDRYTHSALALEPSLNAMYSFSRAYSRFPFYGKFRKESPDTGFLARCRRIPAKVIALPVTSEQYDLAEQRLSYFSDHAKRYGYNYIGMFLNLIGKSHASKRRYTCSQFVSETLFECGIAEFDRPFSLIRPVMLEKLRGEVIYEGNLHEYTVSAAATV